MNVLICSHCFITIPTRTHAKLKGSCQSFTPSWTASNATPLAPAIATSLLSFIDLRLEQVFELSIGRPVLEEAALRVARCTTVSSNSPTCW